MKLPEEQIVQARNTLSGHLPIPTKGGKEQLLKGIKGRTWVLPVRNEKRGH